MMIASESIGKMTTILESLGIAFEIVKVNTKSAYLPTLYPSPVEPMSRVTLALVMSPSTDA